MINFPIYDKFILVVLKYGAKDRHILEKWAEYKLLPKINCFSKLSIWKPQHNHNSISKLSCQCIPNMFLLYRIIENGSANYYSRKCRANILISESDIKCNQMACHSRGVEPRNNTKPKTDWSFPVWISMSDGLSKVSHRTSVINHLASVRWCNEVIHELKPTYLYSLEKVFVGAWLLKLCS